MVEQALQALTLHIMWNATGLTATEDPSPEEAKSRMKLVEQREGLLEKLVEYAIGGRSNAVENVKRSVRTPKANHFAHGAQLCLF